VLKQKNPLKVKKNTGDCKGILPLTNFKFSLLSNYPQKKRGAF